jgi:S-DNA-T family DNA segregation ATPase FtsK/SpoIIIE
LRRGGHPHPGRARRPPPRLAAELTRRQDLLAADGFAGITEQRAAAPADQRLPHILVLLDRWEGFTTTLGEAGGGTLTDVITRILSEGASAGVHLIMTGDRSLLAGRIAAMCEDRLVFKLAERDDYALAGLRPRDLPADVPPGRTFTASTGTETQIALLAPDPSGQAQAAALRQIADWAAALDAGVRPAQRPFRVDVLPSRITFAEAWQLRPPGDRSPLWGLAGVGGDELTSYRACASPKRQAQDICSPPLAAAQGTTESVPSVFCGQNWIVIVHQRIARRDGSS